MFQIWSKLNQFWIIRHNSLVNVHSSQRWTVVSGLFFQSLQIGSCGHFVFYRLIAVRILRRMCVTQEVALSLCLSFPYRHNFAAQKVSFKPNLVHPLCEFGVYSPSAVHFNFISPRAQHFLQTYKWLPNSHRFTNS